MAFLGTSGNEDKNVYFVKIQGLKKGSDKVYFEVQKKDAEGNYVIVATPWGLKGNLDNIKVEKFQYDGQEQTKFKLVMSSEDDLYFLTLGNNKISRTIFNCLASAELIGEISMGLYNNDKGYPAIWVKNDGEKLDWKYSLDELNKKVDVQEMKNGKKIYDASELEEFFEKEVVKNITSKLSPKMEQPKPVASQEEEEEDDDLPF